MHEAPPVSVAEIAAGIVGVDVVAVRDTREQRSRDEHFATLAPSALRRSRTRSPRQHSVACDARWPLLVTEPITFVVEPAVIGDVVGAQTNTVRTGSSQCRCGCGC